MAHVHIRRLPACVPAVLYCAVLLPAGLDGGHLAINYWFHPPDHLDPGKSGFNKPYTSPYYPTVWANRRGWLQSETQAWWQQQQQQHHSQQNKQQPKQRQQQQQPGATGSKKRRRINWAPSVGDPGNVYQANNTRAGTATGDCKIHPQHSGLMR